MNEGEFRNMEFQSRTMDPSSFFGFLFSAIYKADSTNRAKLFMGFPEEVESVQRWKNEEGYAQKLRAAFHGKSDLDGFKVE